jgi:uncharacterized phage-associated protein
MFPPWYNPRKAAQVAAYFANAQGGKINVLKLVKLIYLADREALRRYDAPILMDKFVSMEHGPVNSLTLNQINGCSDESAGWDEFITDREGHLVGMRKESLGRHDLDELSEAEIRVLRDIWEQFGGMGRYQLRDYTHDNCPEWEDPDGSSSPIPLERILKFLGKPDGGELAAKLESERIMDTIFARADALSAGEEIDPSHAFRAAG